MQNVWNSYIDTQRTAYRFLIRKWAKSGGKRQKNNTAGGGGGKYVVCGGGESGDGVDTKTCQEDRCAVAAAMPVKKCPQFYLLSPFIKSQSPRVRYNRSSLQDGCPGHPTADPEASLAYAFLPQVVQKRHGQGK